MCWLYCTGVKLLAQTSAEGLTRGIYHESDIGLWIFCVLGQVAR